MIFNVENIREFFLPKIWDVHAFLALICIVLSAYFLQPYLVFLACILCLACFFYCQWFVRLQDCIDRAIEQQKIPKSENFLCFAAAGIAVLAAVVLENPEYIFLLATIVGAGQIFFPEAARVSIAAQQWMQLRVVWDGESEFGKVLAVLAYVGYAWFLLSFISWVMACFFLFLSLGLIWMLAGKVAVNAKCNAWVQYVPLQSDNWNILLFAMVLFTYALFPLLGVLLAVAAFFGLSEPAFPSGPSGPRGPKAAKGKIIEGEGRSIDDE
jgi:hypothetical protein